MTGFTPELVERKAVVRFIREAAYTAWEDRPEGQLFLSLAKDIENEEHLHFVGCRPAAASGIAELTEAMREAREYIFLRGSHDADWAEAAGTSCMLAKCDAALTKIGGNHD